jgi:hypothetical protein
VDGIDWRGRVSDWFERNEPKILTELETVIKQRVLQGKDIKRGDFVQVATPPFSEDNKWLYSWNGEKIIELPFDHHGYGDSICWPPAEYKCPTEFTANYFYGPNGIKNDYDGDFVETRLDVEKYLEQLVANIKWLGVRPGEGVVWTSFVHEGTPYYLYDTDVVASSKAERQKELFAKFLKDPTAWCDEDGDDTVYLVRVTPIERIAKHMNNNKTASLNVFYNMQPLYLVK